jgi:hypothetical protein
MARKESRHRVKDTYLSEIEHRPRVVTDLLNARTAISELAGFREGKITPKQRPLFKRNIQKVGVIDDEYNGNDEFGVIVVRGSIRSLARKYNMRREDAIAALHQAHAFMLPKQDNFYLMPTTKPVAGE